MTKSNAEPAITTSTPSPGIRVRSRIRAGVDKKKDQQEFLVVKLENVLVS